MPKTCLENPRELRGLAILSMGDAIIQYTQTIYSVRSQTGIGEYLVKKKGKRWFCNCPDFVKRQQHCKHVYAVLLSKKLKADVEEDVDEEIQQIDFRPTNCLNCKGEHVIKSGIRKTKRGNVQRYKCIDCGLRFVIDKGFSRMKHTPKAITLSMDLYFKGISYRKICDHLKQFYNLRVNPSTPLRWIQKYLKLLSRYSDQYKAKVSNIWHSDEMTINIKKKGEKGYYEWIWNVMDSETRYLLACRVTKTKFKDDARKPLRDAKKRTNKRPDAIVTDGLQAYKTAIKKEFYDKSARIHNPHFRLKSFEIRPNNNIIERLNNTYRERLKIMRGLSKLDDGNDFAEAMRFYYNYLRPHQALNGFTPAQMAGIPIDLDGNRWLKMIELSNMSNLLKMQETQI